MVSLAVAILVAMALISVGVPRFLGKPLGVRFHALSIDMGHVLPIATRRVPVYANAGGLPAVWGFPDTHTCDDNTDLTSGAPSANSRDHARELSGVMGRARLGIRLMNFGDSQSS
jgi:hypothetical protein